MSRRPLPSILNRVLLISLAAACGGRVNGSNADSNGGEGDVVDAGEPEVLTHLPDARVVDVSLSDVGTSTDATLDASWDAGGCTTTGAPDASSFTSCVYELPFYGDPATCGLDHAPGPPDVCAELCWSPAADGGRNPASCQLVPVDGSEMLQCQVGCLGRRPEGLRRFSSAPRSRSVVGEYLARAAYLEAASVDAFRILQRELACHGCPERLLRAARRAARDEVRHARMTTAMARRHCGPPSPPVRSTRDRVRSLEAIAIENAVEGCVRETYGALVAGWQANAARDRAMKAMMTRIARDEARHAELSWAVASWIERRLDRAARERVREARQAAAADLARELRAEPHPDLVAAVGLPSALDAARLHAGLERSLWDVRQPPGASGASAARWPRPTPS
jgi:hypothetical protein